MRWIIEVDGEVIAETCVPELAEAMFEAAQTLEGVPVVTMWQEGALHGTAH